MHYSVSSVCLCTPSLVLLSEMAGTDIEDALEKCGLRSVTLKNTSGNGFGYTVQWLQFNRKLCGCKEQYRKCRYETPNGSKVAVFVAEECGSPPDKFNTSSYKGLLHAGAVGVAVFFVIHPRDWTPYKQRFMTEQEVRDQQQQCAKETSAIAKLWSQAWVGNYLHHIG